jgi:chitodextrinase
VTITGANFGATRGTSTVQFAGTGATPNTWSATSIAVPVPAGATSGNVVVTVGGQPSNGMSFAVTSALDTQAPTAPANLTAMAVGGSQLNLNWTASTDNVGVAGYRVEQCLGAGCTTFTEIGTVNAGGGPSTGPLTASANPNYFKDASGTPLILNGSHTWNSLQDWGSNGTLHALDFSAFVNFLVAHGHNFTYLWAIETPKFCGLPTSASAPPDFTVGPHPWQRTGPGTATDGAMKFDLTKFNQAYFDRLRTRTQALNAAGIYAGVYLFTGEWLNQYRCATDGYPFTGANNINSVDAGGSTGSVTMSAPNAITAFQDAYVEKVIDTLNDLPNVLWLVSEEAPASSTWWNTHQIAHIRSYESGLPLRHPIGYGVLNDYNDATITNSNADFINPFVRLSPTTSCGTGTPPCKVNINDSDHSNFGMWNTSAQQNRIYAWENFTNGNQVMFMDPYVVYYPRESRNLCPSPTNGICSGPDARWDNFRDNLGYILRYSRKLNLASVTPRSSLCSTNDCLAQTPAVGAEYLIYDPNGGAFTVNLSAMSSSRTLNVEWFNPSTGATTAGGTVPAGSSSRSFTPPFSGDAVLYLVDSTGHAGSASTPGTSYSVTGLASGPYGYRVRAADAAGNLSIYSNVATATIQGSDTQPPTAPGGLTAITVSAGRIDLAWTGSTDNVGVTGYRIERCQGAGCTTFAQMATTTATTLSDTGLTPSTSYTYRVRANDAAGNLSGASSTASATTTAATAVGVTLVQHIGRDAGLTTSSSLAFTSNNTAGNWIGVAIRAGQSGQAFTVTDARGNVYRKAVQLNETADLTTLALYYAENILGGTNTITVADSISGGTLRFEILEYAGIALANSVDVTAAAQGNSSLPNSGIATTTANGDLVIGLTSSANPVTVVAGTGYVIEDGVPAAPNTKLAVEDQQQNAAGPVAATATFSASNNWGAVLAAFRTAGNAVASDTNPPAAPVMLTATAVSSTRVDLQWGAATDNVGVTAYRPERCQDAGCTSFEKLTYQPLPTGTTYSDTGLSPNTTYSYIVRATDAAGNLGPYSNIASVTTPAAAGTTPLITLSPATLTFANQATGTTSAPQNVTVTNTGAAPLTLGSISVTGVNRTDFAQSSTCGTSLAQSSSCTISVTFTPSAAGTRSAAVAIADNATGAPHSVPLFGTSGSFTISPVTTVLTPTLVQQFSASSGSGAVSWLVDGVVGGSAALGTITPTGLYSPPNAPGTHTVTAATTSPGPSASATVYVTTHPGVFTHHNDNARTGQNLNETVLSPANVSAATFGKLASFNLDGNSHASPLYVAGVAIPGQGTHNVVYAATEHDSVYAFDADGLSTQPLWKVSFINPAAGVTTVPSADTGECCDIAPEIGITGTPVIDPVTRTLYVVAKTKESGTYRQRLHALDIGTGAEKFGGPVLVQASVPGNGAGAQGGNVPFDALHQNQRLSLLLNNGVVYVGFGAHGDVGPYHGWLLGYNAATLQQVMVHNATPDSSGAGLWQANGGPAADAAGNVYFVTGNGQFDVNTGGRNYGDSFVKISPAGAVLDYFTPHNQGTLNANDWDLGAAGALLIPDQPGPHPHLVVSAGKNNTIYLIDRDAMGHYNASNDNAAIQSLVNVFPNGTPEPGNYSSPVYFNGTVYFGPIADTIQAFRLTNGLLSTTPTSSSAAVYPYPGAALSISANGNTNGILWAIQRNGSCGVQVNCGSAPPGVLRAYDAANLGTQLYATDQSGTRDALDFAAKFSVPLVVNGKVFVTTVGRLTVYGLLP